MGGERPDWMAEGRARVSTFIVVPDAMRVVRFAEDVFRARLLHAPLHRSDGRLWNAELAIGDSTILIGDAPAGMTRPGFLYVHVPDVDATFAAAVAAGARPVQEPGGRFHGARDGGVEDVAGNLWWIATQVEEVGDEEILRRARLEEGA
ncbi:VOC family protein [Roseitranquillus sediminis]|uniref:VOC family protein n=1 Tax=Roseitranquillus sediminis TaxID=2809051 RepID=UPI001D0C73D3|nr:VOC family protein [Roseitranquillus sediminis]MBM9593366.1 hypothetical protein [Roseitranquillus sediminis]